MQTINGQCQKFWNFLHEKLSHTVKPTRLSLYEKFSCREFSKLFKTWNSKIISEMLPADAISNPAHLPVSTKSFRVGNFRTFDNYAFELWRVQITHLNSSAFDYFSPCLGPATVLLYRNYICVASCRNILKVENGNGTWSLPGSSMRSRHWKNKPPAPWTIVSLKVSFYTAQDETSHFFLTPD